MPTEHDNVADFAVEQARRRTAETEAKKAEAEATHHDMALSLREHLSVGAHHPVYANGSFYLPTTPGLWRPTSHERLCVTVAQLHGGKKLCKRHTDFKQVVEHLAALCEGGSFFDDAPIGVVSPAGFHRLGDGGVMETVPLSLTYRQTFTLPDPPEHEAEAPHFERVLREAFEGDHEHEQVDLFFECLGASLLGLLPRQQVVVLMIGRERSGKSLIQRLVERLFPAEAVAAVSPASWGHEYHVAALAGKRLNVVGELSDEAPIPAAAFKNLTGGNLVGARHPTHRPFAFVCLASHWLASNVLPPTTDRSEAFYRRWRVLRFSNTVPPERVDPNLFDKILAAEMPAILGKAFAGAERVAQLGAVRETEAHRATLRRWRLAANPLEQFLSDPEWVEIAPEARDVGTPELYEAYRRWSAACGLRHPFGRNHFLELLEATGAGRGISIKRIVNKNVVVGLRVIRNEP